MWEKRNDVGDPHRNDGNGDQSYDVLRTCSAPDIVLSASGAWTSLESTTPDPHEESRILQGKKLRHQGVK